MGNITAVNMDDKHYFREKGKAECPNTEHQQTHHRALGRGVTAWQSLEWQWDRLGEQARLSLDKQEGLEHEGYVEKQYNIGAVRVSKSAA